MPTVLDFDNAWIDWTGTELVLEFTMSGSPLGSRIGIARSVLGIPELLRDSVPIRLIESGCDWEVDRLSTPQTAILRARYRIHDDDRAVKKPLSGSVPLWKVTAPAGLVEATDHLSTEEIDDSVEVDNRSFVGADGWADINQQGYDPDPGSDVTVYVNALTGVMRAISAPTSTTPSRRFAALRRLSPTASSRPTAQTESCSRAAKCSPPIETQQTEA